MTRDTQALASKEPLGKPSAWARDFALIGAATGLAAPLAATGVGVGFAASAAVAGAVTGLLLGFATPKVLARLGGVRLPMLMFGGLGVGAIWGATVGGVAAAATTGFVVMSMIIAAFAGALQFGWMWLPYVLKTIGKKRTWPLVAGAMAAGPLVGFIAVWLFMFFFF